jgi:hypothetical protein
MRKQDPSVPKRLSAAKQRRMDELLEKNNEGTITPAERERLSRLVDEAERLMVANAKRLVEFSRNQESEPPRGAVPVTVWVSREPEASAR